MNIKSYDKWKVIIINILLFIFLLIFFIRICPIVPYDTDDWIFLGQMRIPLPIWQDREPTRVFPQILMPICGYISAYFTYPIIGKYFYAITITAAVIVAFFIILLCFSVMKLMRKRLNLSVNISLMYEILFLLFNFAIFRNRGTSRYMFYADNMTCIFHYTLSGIINAVVVLIMMQYKDFQITYNKYSNIKKGLFVTLVYFALLSNIFHSATLAIYCGVVLLFGLLKMLKKKEMNIKNFIQSNKVYLIILCSWIVVIIFEMNGGRAANVSDGKTLSFMTSIKQLYALVQAIAKPFAAVIVISICWMLFRTLINLRSKGKLTERFSAIYIYICFNLSVLVIYLLVLCSGVNYMSRIEASWNIWFYVILLTLIGIADFITYCSSLKPFLVPMLFIVAILAFYPDGKFLMSTANNVDYKTCINTGEYMLNQLVIADNAGYESVITHAPEYTDEDKKWIFGDNFGKVVATTLYNHGIIRNKLDVYTYNEPELIDKMRIINN